MTQLFVRLAQYFSSHRTVCWLSMVALFAFFGYFATQIHLEEDINKLMPSSKNEDGSTKLAFADLKIKDKVFLLLEGKDADMLIETCDAFVDSLLAQDKDSVVGDIFYRLDEDLLPDAVDYIMASVSGLKGLPGQTNYSAAKGGIIAATKALAQEVARRNITVNAIAPGFIKTDMTEGLDEKALKQQIPMRRFGTPQEVADAVAFLVSPQAGYITGNVISINGGLYT